MKRIVQFITLALAIVLLSTEIASGQQATTAEKSKQKEAELAQKDADLIQKKADELQKAEADLESHVDAIRDYEIIRKKAEGMSGNNYKMLPDEAIWNMEIPYPGDFNSYGYYRIGDKPGSLWNYSRQVLESTFTNEFIMDSGADNGNATLSLSGTCAEGAITVAIIMPDGKQLSEVIIDANGSLNWRKSFEAGEGNDWKNGKWIFKIKAKEATGNFRISMTTN